MCLRCIRRKFVRWYLPLLMSTSTNCPSISYCVYWYYTFRSYDYLVRDGNRVTITTYESQKKPVVILVRNSLSSSVFQLVMECRYIQVFSIESLKYSNSLCFGCIIGTLLMQSVVWFGRNIRCGCKQQPDLFTDLASITSSVSRARLGAGK